jgi:hypothetical protein
MDASCLIERLQKEAAADRIVARLRREAAVDWIVARMHKDANGVFALMEKDGGWLDIAKLGLGQGGWVRRAGQAALNLFRRPPPSPWLPPGSSIPIPAVPPRIPPSMSNVPRSIPVATHAPALPPSMSNVPSMPAPSVPPSMSNVPSMPIPPGSTPPVPGPGGPPSRWRDVLASLGIGGAAAGTAVAGAGAIGAGALGVAQSRENAAYRPGFGYMRPGTWGGGESTEPGAWGANQGQLDLMGQRFSTQRGNVENQLNEAMARGDRPEITRLRQQSAQMEQQGQTGNYGGEYFGDSLRSGMPWTHGGGLSGDAGAPLRWGAGALDWGNRTFNPWSEQRASWHHANMRPIQQNQIGDLRHTMQNSGSQAGDAQEIARLSHDILRPLLAHELNWRQQRLALLRGRQLQSPGTGTAVENVRQRIRGFPGMHVPPGLGPGQTPAYGNHWQFANRQISPDVLRGYGTGYQDPNHNIWDYITRQGQSRDYA